MDYFLCSSCCFKRGLEKDIRVSMFYSIDDFLKSNLNAVINCVDCKKRISIFNNKITTALPVDFEKPVIVEPIKKSRESLQIDFFELMRIQSEI